MAVADITMVEKPLCSENGRGVDAETEAREPVSEESIEEVPFPTPPKYEDASVKCGRLDRPEVVVPIIKPDKLDVFDIIDAREALTDDDTGIGRAGL